jgi:hypothetical protein
METTTTILLTQQSIENKIMEVAQREYGAMSDAARRESEDRRDLILAVLAVAYQLAPRNPAR